MSEIEQRQLDGDGAESFERLIRNYSPLEIPRIADSQVANQGASDLNYQADVLASESIPGTVPDENYVVSIFDSLPKNAQTFLVNNNGTSVAFTTFNLNYTVPSGFRAIVRDFSFYAALADEAANEASLIDSLGFETSVTTVTCSFLINDSPVSEFGARNLGFAVDNKKVFIRTNSLDRITLRLTVPAGFLIDKVDAKFSGILLMDTGQTSYGLGATEQSVPVYSQRINSRAEPNRPASVPVSAPASVQVSVPIPAPVSLNENYSRYQNILSAAKNLKLVNPSLEIPPYSAYKAGERSIWRNTMPALIRAIKNLTGRDI